MSSELRKLIESRQVWHAGATTGTGTGRNVPTGNPALDESLPGGGWPAGALTEILVPSYGLGELRLTVPLLRNLSRWEREHSIERQTPGNDWLVWVAPPLVPYAPALTTAGIDLARLLVVHPHADGDTPWAAEQALRSGVCAAVLVWTEQISNRWLRRLQLAAEQSNALGIVFRPAQAVTQHSPAALRLALSASRQGTSLRVVKCRGGRPPTLDEPILTPDFITGFAPQTPYGGNRKR